MRSFAVLFSLVASAAALNLQPRQTGISTADSGSCLEAALSLAEALPTPPPALISDVESLEQLTGDPCQLSIPSSLSSDFSSYSSEVQSWMSANQAEIQSIETECAALLGTTFSSFAIPVCTSGANAVGSSGPASAPAASGTAASSGAVATKTGSTASASVSKANAAPRETGMVLAAMAAAGLAAVAL